MINRKRLARCFETLVKIDSISREEKNIAIEIKKILESLGATVKFDKAGEKVGGNIGNLIAIFKGNVNVSSFFLCAHMDTVEPGRGIKPVLKDGIFTSDGTTILGADDKSAIAIIIETLNIIIENNLKYGPIEIIFTICEEIGLVGAKHFDLDQISSTFGYILDSTDTEGIVTRAPAANKFEFTIYGKEAHAGASPEKGINAISIGSHAISKLTLGRIDEETTCNIGIIKGGTATNVIPKEVTVKGEARSHCLLKLKKITDAIVFSFVDTVDQCKSNLKDTLPMVKINVFEDFPATNIPEDHEVIQLAKKAAKNLSKKMALKTIGGGADANIFFNKGIVAGVLGTGMTDVHSVRESVKLDDMENTIKLLLEIIKIHSQKNYK